ncbi:hypothetical protein WN53_03785 [Serratia fonticola]|nr:hypothetical protein WN53_03785 [Serratia fonticola]
MLTWKVLEDNDTVWLIMVNITSKKVFRILLVFKCILYIVVLSIFYDHFNSAMAEQKNIPLVVYRDDKQRSDAVISP